MTGSSGRSPILTPREIEVLRWFSAGKSAEEVGIILSLSAATVMFHYRQAADALGTVNRTHTVAEAIRLGLLESKPDGSNDAVPGSP